PTGLQNAFSNNRSSTFSYGAFYVTTSFEKAARYAIRNQSGSELLQFISEGLQVLDTLPQSPVERLRSSHSALLSYMQRPAAPVVLELAGIAADRLTDENGGSGGDFPLLRLAMELEDQSDIEIEPSFRVSGVTRADITAIYGLPVSEGDLDQMTATYLA